MLLRNFRNCTNDVKCMLFKSFCANMYCCPRICRFADSVSRNSNSTIMACMTPIVYIFILPFGNGGDQYYINLHYFHFVIYYYYYYHYCTYRCFTYCFVCIWTVCLSFLLLVNTSETQPISLNVVFQYLLHNLTSR